MEKVSAIINMKLIKKILMNIINYVLVTLIIIAMWVIAVLHMVKPFFPILFLFDLCFWVAYPLFLRYILKKKWFDCTKDDYLEMKYIAIPSLIMEVLVMLYYRIEVLSVLQNVMNNA